MEYEPRDPSTGPPEAVYFSFATRKVEIIPGLSVYERFSKPFDIDGIGRVVVDVAVTSGRARATAVHIYEAVEEGVSGLTLNKTAVQPLVEIALRQAVAIFGGRESGAVFTDRRGELDATIRRKVDDERLRRVAGYERAGGLEAIIKGEEVSPRHARRLRSQAIEKGFLTAEDER